MTACFPYFDLILRTGYMYTPHRNTALCLSVEWVEAEVELALQVDVALDGPGETLGAPHGHLVGLGGESIDFFCTPKIYPKVNTLVENCNVNVPTAQILIQKWNYQTLFARVV